MRIESLRVTSGQTLSAFYLLPSSSAGISPSSAGLRKFARGKRKRPADTSGPGAASESSDPSRLNNFSELGDVKRCHSLLLLYRNHVTSPRRKLLQAFRKDPRSFATDRISNSPRKPKNEPRYASAVRCRKMWRVMALTLETHGAAGFT